MLVHLNILICEIKLDKMHEFYQFLTQTYCETGSNDHLHTEFVQTKFIIGLLHLDNQHQSFWQLIDHLVQCVRPGLAESNSYLACVSAVRCLKFYDDTPSVAVFSTLNNPQDLDRDNWRPVC